jgi:hypothetical protein
MLCLSSPAAEYLGEGGESEFLGEDGEFQYHTSDVIQMTKSKLDMSMSDFLVGLLPIDQFGPVDKLDDINPAMLSHLRNVSLADSHLDPTQKKVLGEWLQTFESVYDMNAMAEGQSRSSSSKSELGGGGRGGGRESEWVGWVPKKVNYEMLSTYTLDGKIRSSEEDEKYNNTSSELEGTAPSKAVTIASTVYMPHPKRKKEDEQVKNILEELGDTIPRDLLNLIGEEDYDSPTPASLLSKEDILCPELGPEEAEKCTPVIHDPSLKR